ncbi:MAG: hypothetical protein ACE5HF_07650, partial [Gemmatimonadota bacterium]
MLRKTAPFGATRMALLFLALLPAGASGQQKRPPPPRGAFELFSGPATLLDANEVECGLTDTGLICVNSFSSPTGGGGFWPRGTIDQYFFDSGLQVAGRTSAAAGPWAGDTVAAYFFDLALGQVHGAPLAGTLDSRSAADVAAWPAEARVSDADRFEPSLLGRVAASEQDSWTQYWDGDPANNTGRKHPMGIRVTQRTLAWNYPLGNESIVYVLFELENVTNDAEFQRLNELEFFAGADALPNAGWPIDSIWLGYAADYDVSSGGAGQNFSTVIHPFDMGISYHGAFSAPQFAYPGRFFKHPFFRTAPGIVGARFLSTPVDPSSGMPLGLTMFSFTGGPSSVGCCLVEPRGEDQLWRYLSGRFDPTQGDSPCGLPPETPDRRSLCQIRQQSHDTRFYESTGPFSLGPGEKQEIAIAIVVAAAVQLMPDGSPTGIIANASSANANAPGTPSMHPGFASARGCDVNGQNCTDVLSAAQNPVKAIERAAGWVAYAGPPPAGALEGPANKLDASRVQVVPESLLGKALVAQTLFDNKFLLPAPPAAPPFHLVPGDGRVTLVWDPSPSETAGDPFFAVASDPTSALFNPNYRGNPNPAQPHGDVEGYRIWRGTDPSDLRVIAQFDYADTQFLDFTCETVTPTEDVGASAVLSTGDTARVRGFAPGELCPFGAAPRARPIAGVRPFLIFNNGGAGGAPGGAVRRLEDLRADAARLDTVARIASAPGFFLGDSDVPFVFVDSMVQNNFTYFYAVSTFDVNS